MEIPVWAVEAMFAAAFFMGAVAKKANAVFRVGCGVVSILLASSALLHFMGPGNAVYQVVLIVGLVGFFWLRARNKRREREKEREKAQRH